MEEMSNNLVINISEKNEYVNQNWFQEHYQINRNKLFQNNLNFTSSMAITQEDDEIGSQRKKPSSRDPLSHRIIEKRRRDRMNSCLADLSRLIPTSYLKKGRGRIEKTEIIEMAIKHMKHLQAHKFCTDDTKCEISNAANLDHDERQRQFRLGYQECLSEAIRFLVEIEGLFTGDGLCSRMMDFLQTHMNSLQKVNISEEFEECIDVSQTKARLPSFSESTASANEKMDINDSQPIDRTCNSKPVVTSHLREMLESTSKRKSSPNASLSSDSPSLSPNSCHQSEVYNFKKEIKDRFQAHQKVVEEPLKSVSPSNVAIDDERLSNSSLSSLTTQMSDQRSDTSGYSSNSSNKSELMPSVVVPIFALHPSANYYIPLTLEASIIDPLITKESDVNPFPILHPINITVNFSYRTPRLEFNRPVWPPIIPSVTNQNLNFSKTQTPTFSFDNTIDNYKVINNINNYSAVQKNDKFDTTSTNMSSKFNRWSSANKMSFK